MFILSNFIIAVAKLINFAFDAYIIIIFARVVIILSLGIWDIAISLFS